MSVLALALVAASGTVAMPAPVGNRDSWMKPSDIPAEEFKAGNDGSFFYKALVGPNGRVVTCKVLASSALEREQDAFCKAVKRTFKFRPVVDEQGVPTHLLLEENLAYFLPDTWKLNLLASGLNAIVDVEKLQGTTKGKADVLVNIAVDAQGKLRACNPASAAAIASLSRLACKQLGETWVPLPEQDADGKAAAYIRQIKVEFREKKAAG